MTTNRKRPRESEILICCHSAWNDSLGYTTIPEGVQVYLYAPLGAALSTAIPAAVASGATIKPGDLTVTRISPITLWKFGYDNTGNYANDYRNRDAEVLRYPILLEAGDTIPNYYLQSPGKEALATKTGTNIVVENVVENVQLATLLARDEFKNKVCHFGGCAWVSQEFSNRDIVMFKDASLQDKYSIKLTEEEKRAKRAERFGPKS